MFYKQYMKQLHVGSSHLSEHSAGSLLFRILLFWKTLRYYFNKYAYHIQIVLKHEAKDRSSVSYVLWFAKSCVEWGFNVGEALTHLLVR